MMTKVKACRAVNIIITAVFVVALFLFLLSFAVSLPILNRWFYFIQIGPLRLEQATGHTCDEIKEAYNEIMDYLLLPGREFGAGVFEFSESGAAHFADCKPLFVLDVALAGTCGAVTAVIAALHFAKVVQIGRLAGLSAAFWTALAAIAVPTQAGGNGEMFDVAIGRKVPISDKPDKGIAVADDLRHEIRTFREHCAEVIEGPPLVVWER